MLITCIRGDVRGTRPGGQPAAMGSEGVAMVSAQPQPERPQQSEQRRNLKVTCMTNLLWSSGERVYFKDRMSRFLLVSEGWIEAYTPGQDPEKLVVTRHEKNKGKTEALKTGFRLTHGDVVIVQDADLVDAEHEAPYL